MPLHSSILMAKESPTERSLRDRQSVHLSDFVLEDLLPHRGFMLLIGEILEVDSVTAVTLSKAALTWPMAGQGGVSPLIFVELAAQTAGVCNGWERIRKLGPESDQMGWLVGIKRAEFYVDCLPFDLPVTTRTKNTLVFEKFREVTGQIHYKDHLLAEVVLQLYQA
jgi:predicted hotdog family 3-hydroxylacyl-ACP dehydratase